MANNRRGVSGAYKSSVRRSPIDLHFTRSNFSSLRVVMDYIQLVFCDCMYRFSMYPVCVQNSEEKTVHTCIVKQEHLQYDDVMWMWMLW